MMANYPFDATCTKCGAPIKVHWSSRKEKEYSRNLDGEFHKCYPLQYKKAPEVHSDAKLKMGTAIPKKEDEWSSPEDSPNEPKEKYTQLVPKAEFESADQTLRFERTFKLVEITVTKTRKASSQTISELPQYENISYFIGAKMECELGADLQRIVAEKMAAITRAIEQEIQKDRLRLSGVDPDG